MDLLLYYGTKIDPISEPDANTPAEAGEQPRKRRRICPATPLFINIEPLLGNFLRES